MPYYLTVFQLRQLRIINLSVRFNPIPRLLLFMRLFVIAMDCTDYDEQNSGMKDEAEGHFYSRVYRPTINFLLLSRNVAFIMCS